MITTKIVCPLGKVCEEVVDGHIARCAWYTELKGNNPQTGEESSDKGCAIAWLPILQVELSRTNMSTAAAVVSLREETVKRQDAALTLAFSNAKVIEND